MKNSFHPYAAATIVCWSLAYVFTRMALRCFSAFSLGFLRYAVASITLLAVVLIMRIKPPKPRDLLWFIPSGAAGFFLYMVTFNKGCETVTASTSSVVIASVPIITAVLARFIYRERLSVMQWIATGVGFAGVIVLMWNGGFSVNTGILWLLGAALLLSLYNLLQRRLTKDYSALQVTSYSIFAGTLMLAIFSPRAVNELVTAPPEQYVYLLILGVLSSAVAYICWAKAFSKAKNTSSVSNYMFVTPLLTTLLGAAIAGERVQLLTAVGGVIILAALLLFNSQKLFRKEH